MAKDKRGAYGHLLTGALSDFVTEQLTRPPEDQNDLQEEVALMRAASAKSVEAFNAAIEGGNPGKILIAGQFMKKELESVAKIASVASKIQKDATDQITRAGVELIISGIIDIIFNVCRVHPNGLELAAAIEREIAAKVNLNIDRGTLSLPSDELVAMMDLSVGVEDKKILDAEINKEDSGV